MTSRPRILLSRLTFVLALLLALTWCRPADAYSVLSHEEVVDMAWKTNIVPMLKTRFPGISDDEIRQAHAYAYGGSVIQDIGYYPFGSHYFSDLLHYVRPEAFVAALIRDSETPNEYAFALGALAHYCGDTIGHPAINKATADENPPLQTRFGRLVTYAEDPTAHIRTEFGFDVVEVAHGHYSQQNYRDFIGFQVSKTLMEEAFLETYGIPITDVMKHEDLAISTYRRSVSSLIPNMTRLAFATYKDQIEQAAPGTQKSKFLYRLNQTEYNKEFGTDYTRVGIRGQILAFILRFLPKVGPLKALKVTIPNAQEQDVYLKSVNDTVDKFKVYLGEVHALPAPIPPPDPKDAAEARKAADKLNKDADKYTKLADKAQDPGDKAKKEKAAENVQSAAQQANATADRTEAKVDAAQAATDAGKLPPTAKGGVPLSKPVTPPTSPTLPHLDLDTGRPSAFGEYTLADQTYAHLLADLIKPMTGQVAAANATPGGSAALLPAKAPTASAGPDAAAIRSDENSVPSPTSAPAPPVRKVDNALAEDIEHFFEHPVPRTGPPLTPKETALESALETQVKANLATFKLIQQGGLSETAAQAKEK